MFTISKDIYLKSVKKAYEMLIQYKNITRNNRVTGIKSEAIAFVTQFKNMGGSEDEKDFSKI